MLRNSYEICELRQSGRPSIGRVSSQVANALGTVQRSAVQCSAVQYSVVRTAAIQP
jgi:hypothetical protein